MKNRKKLISAVVIIILAILGSIFGFTYTDKDVNEITDGIDTIVNIIDVAEIPELEEKDEQSLEVQEANLENEAFERQGEVAYNGSDKAPNISVGEYKGLTYYSQADSRWANYMYSSTKNRTQTMINTGCGPTAAAMIVSSIKGEITPPQMADLFVKYGYRSANSGTYWSAFKWTADAFDIEFKQTSNFDTMVNKLKDNNYVVAICREGLFTYGGHFIVITRIDGDTLKIYDPYLYSGKFLTASRRNANATVSGNTVYISKENFKKYANAVGYFCFKNNRTDNKVNNSTILETKTSTVTSTKYQVKVTASKGLNIRKGASTRYAKVGAYRKNSIVTIVATSNGWGRTDNGYWICLQYTSKISSNTNTSNLYKIATGRKNLNIRKGASTKYKVVGSYKKGTLVKITSIKNGWGKTNKGWICLKYCKKV